MPNFGFCDVCVSSAYAIYYGLKDCTQPKDKWRRFMYTGIEHRRCREHLLPYAYPDGYPNEHTQKYDQDGRLRGKQCAPTPTG